MIPDWRLNKTPHTFSIRVSSPPNLFSHLAYLFPRFTSQFFPFNAIDWAGLDLDAEGCGGWGRMEVDDTGLGILGSSRVLWWLPHSRGKSFPSFLLYPHFGLRGIAESALSVLDACVRAWLPLLSRSCRAFSVCLGVEWKDVERRKILHGFAERRRRRGKKEDLQCCPSQRCPSLSIGVARSRERGAEGRGQRGQNREQRGQLFFHV